VIPARQAREYGGEPASGIADPAQQPSRPDGAGAVMLSARAWSWAFSDRSTATRAAVVTAWVIAVGPTTSRGASASRAYSTSGATPPR